jgi:hypothetical protein
MKTLIHAIFIDRNSDLIEKRVPSPGKIEAISTVKLVVGTLCLFATAFMALAEDITNLTGVVYSNVVVKRVDPDALVVMGNKGIVRIAFQELPETLQQKYHYDPTNAAKHAEQRAAALRATAAKTGAALQRAQEKRASAPEEPSTYSFPLRAENMKLSEGFMNERVEEVQGEGDVTTVATRRQRTKTYTIEAVVRNGSSSRKEFEAVYGDRSIKDVVQPMSSTRIKITATERSALKLLCDGAEKTFL